MYVDIATLAICAPILVIMIPVLLVRHWRIVQVIANIRDKDLNPMETIVLTFLWINTIAFVLAVVFTGPGL